MINVYLFHIISQKKNMFSGSTYKNTLQYTHLQLAKFWIKLRTFLSKILHATHVIRYILLNKPNSSRSYLSLEYYNTTSIIWRSIAYSSLHHNRSIIMLKMEIGIAVSQCKFLGLCVGKPSVNHWWCRLCIRIIKQPK